MTGNFIEDVTGRALSSQEIVHVFNLKPSGSSLDLKGNEPPGIYPNLLNKPYRNKLFLRDDAGTFLKTVEGTSQLDFINPNIPANLKNEETCTQLVSTVGPICDLLGRKK